MDLNPFISILVAYKEVYKMPWFFKLIFDHINIWSFNFFKKFDLPKDTPRKNCSNYRYRSIFRNKKRKIKINIILLILLKNENFRIFNNSRVVVTGHTGFKGSWLTVGLKGLNNVMGLSLNIPSKPQIFMYPKLIKALKM